jgi:hypothetical protein
MLLGASNEEMMAQWKISTPYGAFGRSQSTTSRGTRLTHIEVFGPAFKDIKRELAFGMNMPTEDIG